jgi:hypothetical protein
MFQIIKRTGQFLFPALLFTYSVYKWFFEIFPFTWFTNLQTLEIKGFGHKQLLFLYHNKSSVAYHVKLKKLYIV